MWNKKLSTIKKDRAKYVKQTKNSIQVAVRVQGSDFFSWIDNRRF